MFSSLKLKINVVLDTYNYGPGDTINWKVILKVKKDFVLKDLTVYLFAIRDVKSYLSKGQKIKSQIIYDFSNILERDKSFLKNQS